MPIVISPIPGPPDLELDLSNDYNVWDGVQEIWIQHREDPDTSYHVEKAVLVSSEGNSNILFNRIGEKEVSNGTYLDHQGTWKVPIEYLVGIVDKILPGDYVIDSVQNIIWTILSVNTPRHNDPYDLFCNSLTLNLPFTNTINYYGVEADVDEYGGRVLTKELAYEDLVVALQPITSGEDTSEHKRIFFNTEFYMYLEGDIEASVGDIIEDTTSSEWYEVLSIENRQRIDMYQRLSVKRIVKPDELV